MISVVVAAKDQERQLARTLAALVPAAVEGLVTEVLVVDGGSSDGTRTVADAAGCKLVEATNFASGLRQAASQARAHWLIFLSAGRVLDQDWMRQASEFIDEAVETGRQSSRAALLLGRPQGRGAMLGDALAAIGGIPRSGEALLLSASFYQTLKGHPDRAADAARDLARHIGRRRLTFVRLQTPRGAY